MKVHVLLFITILFFANNMHAQNVDIKLINAIQKIRLDNAPYILNVCPTIWNLDDEGFFNGELKKDSSLFTLFTRKTLKFFKKHNFSKIVAFKPQEIPTFDIVFGNVKSFDKYIVLSKPIINVLFAEVREGDVGYKLDKEGEDDYMGEGQLYLLVFDKNNNVVKFVKGKVVHQ